MEYEEIVRISKQNIAKTEKMIEEAEKFYQEKQDRIFEKKVIENTENFWTYED
jgi:hypothetical protein